MTEIDELPPHIAAMLAQQGGMPNPEFKAAQDRFMEAVREFERKSYAQVQFFGPILCACVREYEWGDPSPPQQGCVVHGYLMTDRETGAVYQFGIPKKW